MRRRRVNKHRGKETAKKQHTTNHEGVIAWWNSLTSRQKLTIFACLLLMTGSVTGFLFYWFAPARSNSANTRAIRPIPRRGASPSILPLAETIQPSTPTINEQNAEFKTYFNSKQGEPRFAYANEIPNFSQTAWVEVKELRKHLRLIKSMIAKLHLSEIEKQVVADTEFCLVHRQSIMGADAMVEPTSGNVLISFNPLSTSYSTSLQNELHHIVIRHINIQRFGDINALDKNKRMPAFYPFLKDNWQVDERKREMLNRALQQGFTRVDDLEEYYITQKNPLGANQFIKSMKPVQQLPSIAMINKLSTADKKQLLNLIEISHNIPLVSGKRVQDFFTNIRGRQSVAKQYYTAHGGENRRIMELASDIYEIDQPIREKLFPEVEMYIANYMKLGQDAVPAKHVSATS